MAKLKTGRHTSALKERRKAIKRELVNHSTKTKVKNLVKKLEKTAKEKNIKLANELLISLFSTLDKASRKNIIHKNMARNQKARLSKLVHLTQPLK